MKALTSLNAELNNRILRSIGPDTELEKQKKINDLVLLLSKGVKDEDVIELDGIAFDSKDSETIRRLFLELEIELPKGLKERWVIPGLAIPTPIAYDGGDIDKYEEYLKDYYTRHGEASCYKVDKDGVREPLPHERFEWSREGELVGPKEGLEDEYYKKYVAHMATKRTSTPDPAPEADPDDADLTPEAKALKELAASFMGASTAVLGFGLSIVADKYKTHQEELDTIFKEYQKLAEDDPRRTALLNQMNKQTKILNALYGFDLAYMLRDKDPKAISAANELLKKIEFCKDNADRMVTVQRTVYDDLERDENHRVKLNESGSPIHKGKPRLQLDVSSMTLGHLITEYFGASALAGKLDTDEMAAAIASHNVFYRLSADGSVTKYTQDLKEIHFEIKDKSGVTTGSGTFGNISEFESSAKRADGVSDDPGLISVRQSSGIAGDDALDVVAHALHTEGVELTEDFNNRISDSFSRQKHKFKISNVLRYLNPVRALDKLGDFDLALDSAEAKDKFKKILKVVLTVVGIAAAAGIAISVIGPGLASIIAGFGHQLMYGDAVKLILEVVGGAALLTAFIAYLRHDIKRRKKKNSGGDDEPEPEPGEPVVPGEQTPDLTGLSPEEFRAYIAARLSEAKEELDQILFEEKTSGLVNPGAKEKVKLKIQKYNLMIMKYKFDHGLTDDYGLGEPSGSFSM